MVAQERRPSPRCIAAHISPTKRQPPARERAAPKPFHAPLWAPCFYTAVNAVSVVGLAAYFAGAGAWSDPRAQLLLELALTLVKAAVEVRCGEMSWDLALHHACFFSTLYGAFYWAPMAKYAWLIVHMHLIHVPLTFVNAKHVAKQLRHERARRAAERVYLSAWPFFASYRCFMLTFNTIRAVRGADPVTPVLVLMTTAFLALDCLWTPWATYMRGVQACMS